MFGNWFSKVRKTFKLNFVFRKTFLWNVRAKSSSQLVNLLGVRNSRCFFRGLFFRAFVWPHPPPEETREGIAALRLVLHN